MIMLFSSYIKLVTFFYMDIFIKTNLHTLSLPLKINASFHNLSFSSKDQGSSHVSLNGKMIKVVSLFGLYFRVTQIHTCIKVYFIYHTCRCIQYTNICSKRLRVQFACVGKMTRCTVYMYYM